MKKFIISILFLSVTTNVYATEKISKTNFSLVQKIDKVAFKLLNTDVEEKKPVHEFTDKSIYRDKDGMIRKKAEDNLGDWFWNDTNKNWYRPINSPIFFPQQNCPDGKCPVPGKT